jgi:nucleoredoxin
VPPKPELDRIAPLVRGDLVGLEGVALRDCSPSRLAGIKYYALYYSALWCPPCHAFTPRLVQFYNQFKPTHPQFELLFVSMDHDARSQVEYMREMHMPWPVVRFEALYSSDHPDEAFKGPGIRSYASTGIPDLVLVDAAGNVLSDSFDSLNNYVGPDHVLADIQAKVK